MVTLLFKMQSMQRKYLEFVASSAIKKKHRNNFFASTKFYIIRLSL